MYFNYQDTCEDVLTGLPDRAKQILVRRFGLEADEKQTLQAIGQDIGITRERVRQIQQAGLVKARERAEKHGSIFGFFNNQLRTTGGLRKEDSLLRVLSPERAANQVFFLLCLAKDFNRILETNDFYTLWLVDPKALALAQKAAHQAIVKLKRVSEPIEIEELESLLKLNAIELSAYLEAAKTIAKGPQGLWGLKDWPEINPKGMRDKAYIVLKAQGKPLHFTQVSELINQGDIFSSRKKAHPQTVHNELIKDNRFVLVGRGLYALAGWGYKPGVVKDVIIEILGKSENPLTKNEIVEKVLKQRFVARNTILLNLHNTKYFRRDLEGKYMLV